MSWILCSVAQVLSLIDSTKRQPGTALSRTAQYKRLSKDFHAQPISKVLQSVRALAVKWMQANGDYAVWEGMSLRSLTMHMAADTSRSYGQHLAVMGTDKEWVDATILNALGCMFRVDVAVWQDGVDPLLVGHSTGPAGGAGDPALDLIHVAMVNDLHFWGVKHIDDKCNPTVDLTVEHGDWMRLPQVEQRKTSKVHGGDTESAVATGAVLQLAHNPMPDADVATELNLCTALVEWVPWEAPSDRLLSAIACLGSKADATRCMLRCQVIRDLVLETLAAADIPVECRYNGSARFRLKHNKPLVAQGRGHDVRQHLELHSMMSLKESALQEHLAPDCHRHGNVHDCLDQFRADISLCRNWRVLWHSLPRELRHEAVLTMHVKSLQEHRASNTLGVWHMRYKVLGVDVCRDAFIRITGIGCSLLIEMREKALKSHQSTLIARELNPTMLIRATNKDKLYLDVRQWLVAYSSNGDQWSHSSTVELPAGRKEFYYLIYVADRKKQGRKSAALSTFLTAWRTELPWLLIHHSTSKFVACGICEYLREQINLTPRTMPQVIDAYRTRLGEHYAFQSAQRLAQDNLEEACLQSNGLRWFMKIDKMDMHAINLPTIWNQLATPFFKQGARILCAVNGSHWAGPLRSPEWHIRTLFEDIPHGSEMQLSTIFLNLGSIADREGYLPEEFVVGSDNTPKDMNT